VERRPSSHLDRLVLGRCQVVARVVADDLDEAEGGPQPAEGRELVIVDLRHQTIMPPPRPEHRAAELPGAARPDIYI
jgi:hypothetical protein